MTTSRPLGRLLNPDASLETDQRIHPDLLTALTRYGMHKNNSGSKEITLDSPIDVIGAHLAQSEARIESFLNNLSYDLPNDHLLPPVTRAEQDIQGVDGNTIRLIIHRPSAPSSQPQPAVVYFHGGGMVTLKTENKLHMTWARNLATAGLISIAVDFRNVVTATGWNHFPTGLNDCAAAVKWIDAHKRELGISKIVLQGESGGANLALATALKANKEGWIAAIDGVYAWVPGISGAYSWPTEQKLKELPSLVECDGYFLDSESMAIDTKMYDPAGLQAQNPLAWPFWASVEDLRGLPPHAIAVSELDPLRDEGIAYWRNLANAGVKCTGRVNSGMIHAGEMIMRAAIGDSFFATWRDVQSFAENV